MRPFSWNLVNENTRALLLSRDSTPSHSIQSRDMITSDNRFPRRDSGDNTYILSVIFILQNNMNHWLTDRGNYNYIEISDKRASAMIKSNEMVAFAMETRVSKLESGHGGKRASYEVLKSPQL
uniref:Uncharacterized protein n=1 Tax=Vespula pensylvanica TaxID=30213 RepID=A0A834P4R2_VESPE|nr:hypothetical protein H0235_006950 [Vespula pensylvanica]